MQKKCSTCRFAKLADEKQRGYECHRFPPTPLLVPMDNPMTRETGLALQGYFPPVNADNWCGEWALESSDAH
jgi:hypothetical protein